MGEVIAFPAFDERQWRFIEEGLRAVLAEENAPADAIDWICEDLKPRYLACTNSLSVSLKVPDECADAVNSIVKQLTDFFHDTTSRMMLEMAKLEAELYAAKSAGSQST